MRWRWERGKFAALFGNSKINRKDVISLPKVVRRSSESPEALLRRFRKSVTRSNLMTEVRRRRWHVSKSEVRRIERKKAMRRMRRRGHSTP